MISRSKDLFSEDLISPMKEIKKTPNTEIK